MSLVRHFYPKRLTYSIPWAIPTGALWGEVSQGHNDMLTAVGFEPVFPWSEHQRTTHCATRHAFSLFLLYFVYFSWLKSGCLDSPYESHKICLIWVSPESITQRLTSTTQQSEEVWILFVATWCVWVCVFPSVGMHNKESTDLVFKTFL